MKIKAEPTTIKSSKSHKAPSTPAAKITKTNELDKSKFLIKNFNDVEKRFAEDTPTKKRSKSKEVKIVDPDDELTDRAKKAKVDKPIDETSFESTPLPVISKPITQKAAPVVRKSPPKYTKIEESLLDGNDFKDTMYNEIFRNIEDPTTKDKYIRYAILDSNSWIAKGFKAVDKNYQLVNKIIVTRMELNLKFNKIFGIINTYGNSLEENDFEFKEKMSKLQKIGEEIRSFIK